MGLFKKRGEFIDYTLLQKRGLLKVSEMKQSESVKSSNGFLDFTQTANSSANTSSAPADSPFSFLDNAAQASAGNGTSHPDLNALKLKIEDIEYKIERLLERLSGIEYKIDRTGAG